MATQYRAFERFPSRQLNIGGMSLGGDSPVRIQSMTTTDTTNVKATARQCISCFRAGADMMRIGVPGKAAVKSLEKIKKEIREAGVHNPVVADIHFSHDLAMDAAGIADKIRINPGNFQGPGTRPEHLYSILKPLTEKCRDHGTVIRIGSNAGSLPEHIRKAHGKGAEALVEATIEYLNVFRALDFDGIVVSVKASSAAEMIRAGIAIAERMKHEGINYPLHTGVTEAGSGTAGRIKSALGIISLLDRGIGDTFRVSLTESPEKEVEFAKLILEGSSTNSTAQAICPEGDTIEIHSDETESGRLIADSVRQYVVLPGRFKKKKLLIKAPHAVSRNFCGEIASYLMQAAGISNEHTDIISCPACARAGADMEMVCREVKARLPDVPAARIAVMGCMVNGPGEMQLADYGIISTGKGSFRLFINGVKVAGSFSLDESIAALQQYIPTDKRNV